MVILLIVILAGFDFAAAVLAREWTAHRQAWQLLGSLAAFLGVFVTFVVGLRYTELSILTFGWIVVLEAAVVTVDWARYGVVMSPGRWVAVGGMLALQAYLVLGTSPAERATRFESPVVTSGHEIEGPVPGPDDQPRAASAAS
jgi:hypothetical protein